MAKFSTARRFYRTAANVRLCAAFTVLALFVFAYLSGSGEGNRLLAVLMKTQFTAVLYRSGLASAASAASVAAALAVGRVFCSVLCPMGALQEACWRAARFLRIGASGGVKPWPARYAVAIAAGFGIIFAIPRLAFFADPISNFGRGMTAISALAGGRARAFTLILAVPFVVILIVSFFRGRRFCDWCPAGVALGALSSIAPFGMKIREGCVSCGLCEKKCPTGCVDSRRKKIDRGRCVLCFSCAVVCPGDFARFGVCGLSQSDESGRRAFLSAAESRAGTFIVSAIYLAGANVKFFLKRWDEGASKARYEDSSAADTDSALPILPPGARSAEHYISRCSACQACVAACPVKILKAVGEVRPALDYSEDYCQYSCVECGRVCPTGAIKFLGAEEKRRTRVALSNLSLSRCVVVTKSQACGACAEVCPTRALRMTPFLNAPAPGLTIPVFDEPYCIGCGACLVVCPAKPVAFSLAAVRRQSETPGIRPTDDDDGLPRLPDTNDFPF
jgi:ferredoxin